MIIHVTVKVDVPPGLRLGAGRWGNEDKVTYFKILEYVQWSLQAGQAIFPRGWPKEVKFTVSTPLGE